ncbi:MAG: DUF188 domain-containing protein [Campylobacterales bacterium]|nr:DUF188 domain-containing protein [Campylobacterales bacterium]
MTIFVDGDAFSNLLKPIVVRAVERVLSKEAHAIDHREERYTPDNIKQYLAMRNLMEMVRDSGVITGGPKPFEPKDAHAFANALHRFLTEHGKA